MSYHYSTPQKTYQPSNTGIPDTIFSHCLPIMAPLAKPLPVRSIQEQIWITAVWNDVVDDRRLRIPTFLRALLAQRLFIPEERLARLAPSSSITTAGS